MYVGSNVNYTLLLSDCNETEFAWQIVNIYWNTKFNENLSSGSQVVPCGWIDMKLIVAFRTHA
jgi:hypothetical protein